MWAPRKSAYWQPRLKAKPENKTTYHLPINVQEKYRKEETPRTAASSPSISLPEGTLVRNYKTCTQIHFCFHTQLHTFKLLASCWLRLCRARSSHPVHCNRDEEQGGRGPPIWTNTWLPSSLWGRRMETRALTWRRPSATLLRTKWYSEKDVDIFVLGCKHDFYEATDLAETKPAPSLFIFQSRAASPNQRAGKRGLPWIEMRTKVKWCFWMQINFHPFAPSSTHTFKHPSIESN